MPVSPGDTNPFKSGTPHHDIFEMQRVLYLFHERMTKIEQILEMMCTVIERADDEQSDEGPDAEDAERDA